MSSKRYLSSATTLASVFRLRWEYRRLTVCSSTSIGKSLTFPKSIPSCFERMEKRGFIMFPMIGIATSITMMPVKAPNFWWRSYTIHHGSLLKSHTPSSNSVFYYDDWSPIEVPSSQPCAQPINLTFVLAQSLANCVILHDSPRSLPSASTSVAFEMEASQALQFASSSENFPAPSSWRSIWGELLGNSLASSMGGDLKSYY